MKKYQCVTSEAGTQMRCNVCWSSNELIIVIRESAPSNDEEKSTLAESKRMCKDPRRMNSHF